MGTSIQPRNLRVFVGVGINVDKVSADTKARKANLYKRVENQEPVAAPYRGNVGSKSFSVRRGII